MPGNPTFTCFRDDTGGTLAGATVDGKAVTVTDSGKSEKFEFDENVTGKLAPDVGAVFGKRVVDALMGGENMNVIALNGQDLLFQDGGTEAGLVHVLIGEIFSAAAAAGSDPKTRVRLSMVDFKRNKITDLLASGVGNAEVTVNSKDGERVPVLEGAAVLAADNASDATGLVDAALNNRAMGLAQGGLQQIVHTVLQVHVARVGGTTQQNAVLTFVNVEVSTDETALAFAAMARDYGAGSKKLKSPDNLLLQVLRTSLGGNAHSVAIAALLPGMSPATTELVVKTVGALARVKDAATAKEFKPDPSLADEPWGKSVAAARELRSALWPADAAAAHAKRASAIHLSGLHTDRLANGRVVLLFESGTKRVGRADSKVKQDIILNGLGIQAEHCILSNLSNKCTITPSEGADVSVNGQRCPAGQAKAVNHNDRVRFGAFQTFRVVVPGSKGPADADFNIQMAEAEIRDAAKAASGGGLSDGNVDPAQQEKIGKLLPMVNEANNISEELKRGINFMLKMVATQGKGATGSDVQVQVTYGDDEEVLWDAETFLDRVYEMRDIYDQFIARGRDLMYINATYTGAQDPFAKQGGESVVGRAMIYLDAVNHLLAVHETTPIIDYKGFTRGELKVDLDLQLPNIPEKEAAAKFDELERVENLKGKQLRINLEVAGIRGLPSNMSEDAYVTFRFFLDEQPVSTPKHTKKTINPKFNFKHSWNLVVTDELCSYLSSDVLEFIVYAKNSGTGTGGGGADAAGEGGGEATIDEETMQQLQEKEEELQELKLQLSEQKVEMERKLREKVGKGGAAGGDSKTDDDVDDLKDRIEFLEQKIETLEAQKKKLEVQLTERDDELEEAQHQLDDDEERMQQQMTRIQELETELAEAKKSKACVIL